ncbi:MAG: NAD(P)/FAD-dependent oxidoreductase [Candidatus Omnitrophota bacterium]
MEQVDITIIGAGIVGLAIGATIGSREKTIYAIEKQPAFGQETSSRNSEVIHAGIYYPENSLKAKLCVQGLRLLYQICSTYGITYKKLGKLVVASEKSEIAGLEKLLANGRQNGVDGLRILSQQEIAGLEPNIRAEAALYSPDTGIVDTHNLMRYFYTQAKENGVEFAFNAEVIELAKQGNGFVVTVSDADKTRFSFFSRLVVNCAGLDSDRVAALAGIDVQQAGYTLYYCKGQYFRVSAQKSRMIEHLIYPLPDAERVSLGIHATPDLGGGLRLGPDARYIARENADYRVDESYKEHFAQSAERILPFVTSADLTADTAGIRPKLQGPHQDFRDFIVVHEVKRGLPGLINLIGIDSPGLTAAPALALHVSEMIKEIQGG